MRLDDGVAAAVGKTPLVRLLRFPHRDDLSVYAKLELMNPNGSAKDRPALRMMRTALNQGRLRKDSVLVESSSGNMAISLATFCAYLGIRFICVIDPKTSNQNVRIMQSLGADIELVTEPDSITGEFLPARLARVQQILATVNGSVWLNQYSNEGNPLSHVESTFAELSSELTHIDYLFVGMSTCGTIHGCAQAAKQSGQSLQLVGVDVLGSKISSETQGRRRFPGLGAGITPPFYDQSELANIIHVSDAQCVTGCRRLAMTEGLLAGASSGGVCAAYQSIENELPEGSVVVLLLHDRGERYLETVFDDAWVNAQFGADLCEERFE